MSSSTPPVPDPNRRIVFASAYPIRTLFYIKKKKQKKKKKGKKEGKIEKKARENVILHI